VSPRPALAEQVEAEAARFRAQGSPLGAFLADELDRLGQLVRWTGATTPEEHRDRLATWESEIQQRHFDRGYAEGLEAGRREGQDLAFQEIGLVLRRSVGLR
jgi:hypothetical protein